PAARPSPGAVRIPARADAAAALVDETTAHVRGVLGPYVWAEGDTTWSEAIGAALGERSWTCSVVEIGTGGSLATLLGDVPWLRLAETLAADAPAAAHHPHADGEPAPRSSPPHPTAGSTDGLE